MLRDLMSVVARGHVLYVLLNGRVVKSVTACNETSCNDDLLSRIAARPQRKLSLEKSPVTVQNPTPLSLVLMDI